MNHDCDLSFVVDAEGLGDVRLEYFVDLLDLEKVVS